MLTLDKKYYKALRKLNLKIFSNQHVISTRRLILQIRVSVSKLNVYVKVSIIKLITFFERLRTMLTYINEKQNNQIKIIGDST